MTDEQPERSCIIRPARPEEADQLTELALRSKAHWGYDAAFMAACRAELTISAARLVDETFIVAELDGRVVGCAGLSVEKPGEAEICGEIEDVFVEPDRIGQGIGGHLMRHLLVRARDRGIVRLCVDADPHAVGFYESYGFSKIGQSPSGSIAGRFLPRLERREITDR